MSNLIYTLAIGEQYRRYATIMVDSVRRFGGFDGDMVVISDLATEIEGAEVRRDSGTLALHVPHMAKALHGFNAGRDYDKVMFLDADVVCVNPISTLFAAEELSAPVECLITNEWNGFFGLPSEPPKEGEFGFNSGTVVAAGRDWKAICERWWNAMIEYKAWTLQGYDQPVFNHLNRSGAFHVKPFNREWVHFLTDDSYPVSNETILIHVKDPMKLYVMRAIYGARSLCK